MYKAYEKPSSDTKFDVPPKGLC